MWKIAAGPGGTYAQDFRSNNKVAIGWPDIGNLSQLHETELSQRVHEAYPEYNTRQLAAAAGQLRRFLSVMSIGDKVIVYDPNLRDYSVGTVLEECEYDPLSIPALPQIRKVRWDGIVRRDGLSAATRNSLGAIMTVFLVAPDAEEEVLRELNGSPVHTLEPARLVDEGIGEDLAEERDIYKDLEERSVQFVQDRIQQLGWDDMQELVAGLLRAMGYKTRVSRPGADRGRDVVASPDGLGFENPRIVAEVKHRRGQMGSEAIRSFVGGLRGGDKGLYVSTGGFTKDAKYEADRAERPVTFFDLEDLSRSVIEHYDNMDGATRSLLPLRKIYWPV